MSYIEAEIFDRGTLRMSARSEENQHEFLGFPPRPRADLIHN